MCDFYDEIEFSFKVCRQVQSSSFNPGDSGQSLKTVSVITVVGEGVSSG